jgi:putative ABC transport system permease protein
MGEGLWRTTFRRRSFARRTQVRLNGSPFTVIGIVRDNVQLQRPAEVWGVIGALENTPRAFRFFQAIGRLKPGVTIDAAQADLAVVSGRLAQAYPESNKDWSVRVEPLRTGVMSPTLQRTSLFLLAVVGFVLLLCCANVANLLLARGNARAVSWQFVPHSGPVDREWSRQLLTESLVLAALGGILGVAIGVAILNVAPLLIPAGLLPAAATFTFDSRVAVFCAVAALSVGVLFGVVPAWQATRTSLLQAISSESRSSTSRGGRLRHVLVAGEVAAAVVLLCGAGLLLRTLLVLDNVDTGYRADGDSVLTLDFSVQGPRPGTRYPDLPSLMQFYDAAAREVSAIPGVRKFGWSTGLPYGTTSEIGRIPMEIVGDPPLAPDDRPRADFQAADPGYFATIDLPIIHGPRLHRSRYRRQPEGRHRQRGVRAPLPRWTGSDWDAHQGPWHWGRWFLQRNERSWASRGKSWTSRTHPNRPHSCTCRSRSCPGPIPTWPSRRRRDQSGRSSHPSARRSHESTGTCRSDASEH